jgi:hypothetical protein
MAFKIAFLEETKKKNVQSTLPSAGRQVQGTKIEQKQETRGKSQNGFLLQISRSILAAA